MTLVRWDPFRDLLNLHQRLGQSIQSTGDAYGSWVPAVDILERGDDLLIQVEVPGTRKDDIEIRVENNTLILSGERKREPEFSEEQAYRLERSFGSFTRSFSLPKTVDSTKIRAAYRDGVLEITLPKAAEAKPRRIAIEVA